MATKHCSTKSLSRAAGYVRMSSGKQERSPKQQRGEITKLAKAEHCEVVLWFSDEAISGDSGPEKRPGFRDMLAAAEWGELQVLLLENQDRLGRFDSVEGAQYFARLRKAGIRIITCADGEIDLSTFEGRIMNSIRQEGKHAFLRDLSRKILRGQVANAKDGYSNGAPPRYGMDRVLVDPAGKIVRRLQPGEQVKIAGHRVRHVPTQDKTKLAAIRFMFKRFAGSDIGYRTLAEELENRGYPGPRGNGWQQATVSAILRNPIYRGTVRWGAKSVGRYHTVQGDEIVTVDNGRSKHKPTEDAITADGAQRGIVPADLFDKVQRKVAKRHKRRVHSRGDFPLSGLIVCGHCGEPLYGKTNYRKDRSGRKQYAYPCYVCQSYVRRGPQNKAGCGHYRIDAKLIQGWICGKLRESLLGPSRENLVAEIKRQLKASSKGSQADIRRMEKRAAELDREIGRLVKAIRCCDAPEIVQELSEARSERDRIKAALSQISHHNAPGDLQGEAERIAGQVWQLGDRLNNGDPAELRGIFQEAVSRITCRWERVPTKNGRTRCQLLGGKVELRSSPMFVPLANYAISLQDSGNIVKVSGCQSVKLL